LILLQLTGGGGGSRTPSLPVNTGLRTFPGKNWEKEIPQMVQRKMSKFARKLKRSNKKRRIKTMPNPVSGPFYGWDNNSERVCRIDRVGKEQLAEFEKSKTSGFKLNDWFVAFDHQQEPQTFGPFKSSEIAFDYCVQIHGIETISNNIDADPNDTFSKD